MIERPRLLDFFPNIESWGEVYDFICCDYLRSHAPEIPTKLMRLLSIVFSVVVVSCFYLLLNYFFDFRIWHLLLIVIFDAVYFIAFVIVVVFLFERFVGTFLNKKYKNYWFYKISENIKLSQEDQESCLKYMENLVSYYRQDNIDIQSNAISKMDKVIVFGENPYNNKVNYIYSPLCLYSEIDRLDYCNKIYETHKRDYSDKLGIFYKSGEKQKFVPWEMIPFIYEFGLNLRYIYNNEVMSDSFCFYKKLHRSPLVVKIMAPHEEMKEIKRYKKVSEPLFRMCSLGMGMLLTS